MKKLIFLVPIILTILMPAFSERIRGNTVDITDLSRNSETSRESDLIIEQFLGITPGNKSDFLEGIELAVRVPADLQEYGDSFILIVYGNITPQLSEGMRNYQGIEIGHQILSSRTRQYIELPLNSSNTTSPVSEWSTLSIEDFPLMITILPMSKGVPAIVDSTPFQLKITPKWKNLGSVEFTSEVESLEGMELWIDDDMVEYMGQKLLLPVGIHTLTARLGGYEEINQSFAVQQADAGRLELQFQPEAPRVSFAAPDGTSIFYDGEKIVLPLESPLITGKGEHTVVFKLGNYQISRQFTAISGKDYEISLFLDILIGEN